MHYLLFHDVVSDYVIRRQPLRAAHLAHARPFVERGEVAAADPYVRQGLLTRWRVRPWSTVVGRDPEVPVS